MNKVYEKLLTCLQSVREKTDFSPEIGLVLGSGLGGYASHMKIEAEIAYKDIEGFPVSTVQGHQGKYLFGYIGSVPVAVMQGRVHYYEGYEISDVVLPIRLMKLMGAHTVMLTNAAGGVNFDFQPGDLMMITDQIGSFVQSPLRGENADELGPRFPGMGDLYDTDLQNRIRAAAAEQKISLKEGVYIQLPGPAYETRQEVRMCRILGADAVGMSTACEAVAAHHMGMKVCGISCISNLACGMSEKPLNHKEVQETADKVAHIFSGLVTASIRKIGEKEL